MSFRTIRGRCTVGAIGLGRAAGADDFRFRFGVGFVAVSAGLVIFFLIGDFLLAGALLGALFFLVTAVLVGDLSATDFFLTSFFVVPAFFFRTALGAGFFFDTALLVVVVFFLAGDFFAATFFFTTFLADVFLDAFLITGFIFAVVLFDTLVLAFATVSTSCRVRSKREQNPRDRVSMGSAREETRTLIIFECERNDLSILGVMNALFLPGLLINVAANSSCCRGRGADGQRKQKAGNRLRTFKFGEWHHRALRLSKSGSIAKICANFGANDD